MGEGVTLWCEPFLHFVAAVVFFFFLHFLHFPVSSTFCKSVFFCMFCIWLHPLLPSLLT